MMTIPTPTKTIVVVDDEEGICDVLRDLFEDEGYQVGVASNGVDALALLQALTTKPCMVILDIAMPLLDGNAVFRAMRADPVLADIPVVFTTSDPSRAPSGVFIMRKPVALDVILDAARKCCASHTPN
jgi:CheY-like chemotaxis protein